NWRANSRKDSSSWLDCRFASQFAQGKQAGEFTHQTILLTLHHSPELWLPIVVATQVQHTMNEIANQFRLPGRAEPARLRHGIVETNENFAAQRSKGSRPVRCFFR